MRKVFAKTSNVNAFVAAMNRLQHRQEGIPGMALIFSAPGLGKTRTALWHWMNNQSNSAFLRIKKLMTGKWLLAEVVKELGGDPAGSTQKLYEQAREILSHRQTCLFIDEVDYLAHDQRILETLRDLHDETDAPITFIGMDKADKKLMRFKHLYSRFSEIVEFKPLSAADIKSIAEQMCEVPLTDDAVQHIYNETREYSVGFRRVVVWLYRAEAIARTNSLKEIAAQHLNGAKR
ncbi:MAG: ATP-binding protein [Nitrospirota bacterium]